MNILALDPATITGYAVHIDHDMFTGVWDFTKIKETSLGDAYNALSTLIIQNVKKYKINLIAVEVPTPNMKKINIKALQFQFGQVGVIQCVAAALDIGYLEYKPNEIFKYARDYLSAHFDELDHASLGLLFEKVKDSKKASCQYFFTTQGRMPVCTDEADATALLGLAMKEQEANAGSNDDVRGKAQNSDIISQVGRVA